MRTSFILYTEMCALICRLRDGSSRRSSIMPLRESSPPIFGAHRRSALRSSENLWTGIGIAMTRCADAGQKRAGPEASVPGSSTSKRKQMPVLLGQTQLIMRMLMGM